MDFFICILKMKSEINFTSTFLFWQFINCATQRLIQTLYQSDGAKHVPTVTFNSEQNTCSQILRMSYDLQQGFGLPTIRSREVIASIQLQDATTGLWYGKVRVPQFPYCLSK